MAQVIFNGTAGADNFNASGETATDIAVFRGIGAGDRVVGGAGADRISLLGTGAHANLGAGNDLFLIVLDNKVNGIHDVIDGGTGIDLLNITASSYQLTDTLKLELVRLGQYLAGDTSQHFVSDILHIDMVNVETSNIRLDGSLKTLLEVAPPPPATYPITFDDLTTDGSAYLPYDGTNYVYQGYVWTNATGPEVYNGAYVSANYGASPATASSGNYYLNADHYFYSPLSVTKSGGGDFYITQVDVAAMDFTAGTTGTVTFTGTKAGVQVGSTTVAVTDDHWTTVQMYWGAIDTLQVSWASAGYMGAALDNMWLS